MDCLQQPPPLDACQAGVAYAYPWSELITRFKFGAQPQWAAFFASLLLASPAVQALFTDLSSDDWVLPMPLAPERLASRGFNQAWELAKALGGQSGSAGRLDARLLLRPLDTPPQSALNRTARLANVAGAFQVEPLRTKALAGRRVVLIDDVMTSGASVYSAAAVLRSAGAAHITAVVLARTA